MYLAGYECRVTIDGATVDIESISIDGDAADLGVENSEGQAGDPTIVALSPGFSSSIPGNRKAKLVIRKATYNDGGGPIGAAGWPFIDAPLIAEGQYVAVRVFPDKADAVVFHDFPSVLVTKVKQEIDVKDKQPVTIEAVSDGGYAWASEQ